MYKHIAPAYNQLHGQEQQRKLKKLLEHTTLQNNSTVADIGCGTAHLAAFFTNQIYIGIDPCKELLDQAPPNTKTICSKGESTPLKDSSQDLVLSLTALHNYSDPIKGVAELHRVAKGVVLVGILKKSAACSKILEEIKKKFTIEQEIPDQHDILLKLHKL